MTVQRFACVVLAMAAFASCSEDTEFLENPPDAGSMDADPQPDAEPPPVEVSGELDPCATADWSWVNSSYRHYEPGYVPGDGAGLKNEELSVGGHDLGQLRVPDEYWSYMRSGQLPELEGVTLSKLEIVFATLADGDLTRQPTEMILHLVVEEWQTEELAPGYTGLHWRTKPATEQAGDLPAPVPGEPYAIDLLPFMEQTMHHGGTENGFALSPVSTYAHMNHFVSCGAAENRPVIRFSGIK